MLPPGHIAGGYITAYSFLKLTHPPLSMSDQTYLLWLGMFFGFAPDIDAFFIFKKMKRFIGSDEIDHRKFYSHVPVIWLVAGLAIFLIASFVGNLFFEYLGILVWLCSWIHFVLDSVQQGIMWLWPWRKNKFALGRKDIKEGIVSKKFLAYWLNFLKFYVTKMKLSFCLELLVIGVALTILINKFI